jgi:hypothetical protein
MVSPAGYPADRRDLRRYVPFMYQQWLRVYMRSQMIQHNKDLLHVVDDIDEVLAPLHIYRASRPPVRQPPSERAGM